MDTLNPPLLSVPRPSTPTVPDVGRQLKIDVERLSFFYGAKRALEDISIKIQPNVVTAFIGPSGCGKSTFLRTLNRMNDIIAGARVEGQVLIDGSDIYGPGVDVVALRRRVGMVFQKSNPFPKSIFDNVAYGLRINRMASSRSSWPAGSRRASSRPPSGTRSKTAFRSRRWRCRADSSSGCASRGPSRYAPDVILMDEPASALDPIATQRIEELIFNLKKTYTIVIVTHNMQQAARVSDHTAFFWLGRLVEYGRTETIFTAPSEKLTEDYLTGRFG